MTAAERLTAAQLRAALGAAERWLALNRDAINSINVYPVPDGDTGTNMLLTLRAGIAAVDATPGGLPAGVGPVMERLARGALLGARGNSGVIASQMLRGAAEAVMGLDVAGPADLARALQRASDVAYASVGEPVEGTMLTVLREGAAAAAHPQDSLLQVLQAAISAAQAALDRTPMQLARLQEAGVVDAGGMGVVVFLVGLEMGVTGRKIPAEPVPPRTLPQVEEMAHTGYGYCTEFVVEGRALDREALIRGLLELGGESVLVVGDPQTLHVHVHLAEPGAGISAGAAVGMLSGVKVDNMQSQHEEWAAATEVEVHSAPRAGLGLVAVARGAGIAAAFRGMGGMVAMPNEDVRPSAGELLEAARRTGCTHVLLLPNDSDVFMAAEQAAAESGGLITVIPSRSMPAGLSAAMAFNPGDTPEQATSAMHAALAGVRCVEVTRALRSTRADGVDVEAGQPIALLDRHVVARADSLEAALIAGIHRAMAEMPAEFVTVYLGSNAPIGADEMVADRLGAAFPGMTIEIVDGGQPHYPYIAGVE